MTLLSLLEKARSRLRLFEGTRDRVHERSLSAARSLMLQNPTLSELWCGLYAARAAGTALTILPPGAPPRAISQDLAPEIALVLFAQEQPLLFTEQQLLARAVALDSLVAPGTASLLPTWSERGIASHVLLPLLQGERVLAARENFLCWPGLAEKTLEDLEIELLVAPSELVPSLRKRLEGSWPGKILSETALSASREQPQLDGALINAEL